MSKGIKDSFTCQFFTWVFGFVIFFDDCALAAPGPTTRPPIARLTLAPRPRRLQHAGRRSVHLLCHRLQGEACLHGRLHRLAGRFPSARLDVDRLCAPAALLREETELPRHPRERDRAPSPPRCPPMRAACEAAARLARMFPCGQGRAYVFTLRARAGVEGGAVSPRSDVGWSSACRGRARRRPCRHRVAA